MKAERRENGIVFEFCGTEMYLSNVGNGTWRLVSSVEGEFNLFGAAQMLASDLGEPCPEESGNIVLDDNVALGTDGTSVRITEKEIVFCDSKGRISRIITAVTKNGNDTKVEIRLSDTERIYGTGERFDGINQHGRILDMYSIDRWCHIHGNSYLPVPLFISSDCSAVFLNRYEHSIADIGNSVKDRLILEQKFAPADIYVIMADSIPDILRNYSALTGFSPMPPEWNFGTLVCRYHPDFSTKDGILEMADAMEKNDFPWDAVITEGWSTYKSEKWDELKEICEKIHKKDKKVLVYEGCGKIPDSSETLGITDEMAVKENDSVWLDETKSDNILDNFRPKKRRYIDYTNCDAWNNWEKLWTSLIDDIGVDGAKIDFCEQFPDRENVKFADGREPYSAHHLYPVIYNARSYGLFSKKSYGGMNLSRGGGIGAQRYPFIWAGDQRREFKFMKPVLSAVLSMGLSGIPFVTWDMAGYQPSWDISDKINENKVFIRGIEFAAFSSNIQTHGKVKRPYDFDEHTKSVYREYAKLHECLKPYLMEQARVSSSTGIPMLRHLCLYDSSDDKCLDSEDEYMLGNGLLVAPILSKKKKRDIYLPKGLWINIFDGKWYDGGQTLKDVDVPLELIPVFRLINAESETIDEVLDSASKHIYNINELCRR